MGLGENGVMEDSAKALYDVGRADAIEGVMAWLERGTPEWKLSANDDWPPWPR